MFLNFLIQVREGREDCILLCHNHERPPVTLFYGRTFVSGPGVVCDFDEPEGRRSLHCLLKDNKYVMTQSP